MKKTVKKVDTIDTTQKKSLGKISLYENIDTIENLTPYEKFVYDSQVKAIKNKKVNIDTFSIEQVFYEIFLKENTINKKTLDTIVKDRKIKLGKKFINTFLLVDTPSEKNYEKKLLEKINNKFILDTIKNSGVYDDKRDYYIIKNTLEKIEILKHLYKQVGYKKLDENQKIIDSLLDKDEKKSRKIAHYRDIEKVVKNYKKSYEKTLQKSLKSRYRLCKKYKFLIDE